MPQNSTRAAADWCRGRRARTKCLRSAGGASPAQTEVIPARLKRTKRCMGRGTLFLGGNLQTKLARGCGGAIYLWLGYPGQSQVGQVSQTARHSHTAAMRPLSSRRQSAVAGDQSPVAGGDQAFDINIWATPPAGKVHADTLAVSQPLPGCWLRACNDHFSR